MENWITENPVILINKPDDPDTFYSRTWRTTSTPDPAIATDDIQGITEREVSSQLGGSDHRPVIISIKGQTQHHRNKLPASWNYKKANWDAFREAVDRKTAALELPGAGIAQLVVLGLAVQCRGFDPPLGTFSGRGDFSLGVNMGSNSIPPKTLSDESTNRGLVCAHMHFIAQTQKILTFMS